MANSYDHMLPIRSAEGMHVRRLGHGARRLERVHKLVGLYFIYFVNPLHVRWMARKAESKKAGLAKDV